MKQRVVLYADQGKVLTDGTIYGKQVFLADGETADKFTEITDEQYEEILQQEADAGYE